MYEAVFTLLLTGMFNCPGTEFINKSNLKWVEHDKKIFRHSQKQCPKRYKRSPCVAKFIKLGFQDYHIICGQELKDGSN